MSEKIAVDSEALRQVLTVLNQPAGVNGHYVREIQATRNLPGYDNPINVLLKDLENNIAVPKPGAVTKIYTKSEMEAMMLYARMKGTTNSNDDPEEGIRFFTSLVDRIREERSVLSIRNG